MSIKYVSAVKPASAKGLVGRVYDQIKREFGSVVEPFAVHSSVPELLTGVWSACRETLLVGRARREVKEAVAVTVSRINRCPYCVDAHTIMLEATSSHRLSEAIGSGRPDEIRDLTIRSSVDWAGASRSPGEEILVSPPFSEREAPEMIGTAVFFHYLNRMANVLLSETPLPIRQSWAEGPLKRVAGWYFAKAIGRARSSGESLGFLPEAQLPGDLLWAKGEPPVAGAFARLAAVIQETRKTVIPIEVYEVLSERLEFWDGKDPGMGRGWVEEALKGFSERSKTVGRLVLLTAFAPYQVDEKIVRSFLTNFPGDDKLLSALAWSSFSAARRIGKWLHKPSKAS
jgi:AhpD family alkylhydroperoxidase